MPLVNYCRKCKAEVPPGEVCPYCGGKIAPSGERLSFETTRVPVRDWFAWNGLLRVLLPAYGLVVALVLVGEAAAGGMESVAALLRQGFLGLMGAVLAVLLAAVGLLLGLQGPELVRYVLDRQGVQARVYVPQGSERRLWARFLSPQAVAALNENEAAAPEGLVLVRRVVLPWAQVRRVRIWREEGVVLLFRPALWQALCVRCPQRELAQVEAFLGKKLKRLLSPPSARKKKN